MLKRMTAFKSRFYTISEAFGVGPMTLKVTEKLILKTLGRPGPHYFKSFPVSKECILLVGSNSALVLNDFKGNGGSVVKTSLRALRS